MTDVTVYYLRFVTFMNAFRTLIYTVNQEHATRQKIAKSDWENLKIRDLAYTWTDMIGLFMLFRTIVFGLGSFLQNQTERRILSIFSFSFDMIILFRMLKDRMITKTSSARQLRHPNRQLCLQSLHIVAFVAALCFEY